MSSHHRLNTLMEQNFVLPSSFLIDTGWFLIWDKAFRKGNVVACSTVGLSATEKEILDGYETVNFLAKVTDHYSTADWIIF